jgi:hypothetical protein
MKKPLSWTAFALLTLSACTAAEGEAAKKTIGDVMSKLALEVCVEGDSARVCARKCEQAASSQP